MKHLVKSVIFITICSMVIGAEKQQFKREDLFIMNATNHMPLAIQFSKNQYLQQLKKLANSAFYNDASLYKPASDTYECGLHPPERNEVTPNQLWIGRPKSSTLISYTPDVTVRLPDRYFGMFLGYAMDHYGLNPGMLMGLSAKESFGTAIYLQNAEKNYFLVSDEKEAYDCFKTGKNGLCTDANLDGPFQVETGGMSTDVSIFAHRFYFGDQTVPKNQRKPMYYLDNDIMVYNGFRQFHDNYTLDFCKAIVLTCLDFHFRHNLVFNMEKLGLRNVWEQRNNNRTGQDSLEFSVAMYTYNRGVYDTNLQNMLKDCGPNKDPCIDCKLDGFGGHTTDIRKICILIDKVSNEEIYDYYIDWDDIKYFVARLESTYPYESVDGLVEKIDWAQMMKDLDVAYRYLLCKRKSYDKKNSNKVATGISFRYDWRALLAVVRMHLPHVEHLIGPSMKNTHTYWGGVTLSDPGPISKCSDFPFSHAGTAGANYNC